jgi:hypothetical protein
MGAEVPRPLPSQSLAARSCPVHISQKGREERGKRPQRAAGEQNGARVRAGYGAGPSPLSQPPLSKASRLRTPSTQAQNADGVERRMNERLPRHSAQSGPSRRSPGSKAAVKRTFSEPAVSGEAHAVACDLESSTFDRVVVVAAVRRALA